MTTQETAAAVATHGVHIYTETELWAMMNGSHPASMNRAFALIMTRVYNGVQFTDPDPMERAANKLFELGDDATVFMTRHFFATAAKVCSKNAYDSMLTTLLDPRRTTPDSISMTEEDVRAPSRKDQLPKVEVAPEAAVVMEGEKFEPPRTPKKVAKKKEPTPFEDGPVPGFIAVDTVVDLVQPAKKPRATRAPKTKAA